MENQEVEIILAKLKELKKDGLISNQIKKKINVSIPKKEQIANEEIFDYAIICALYKDELKFIEPYIVNEGEFENDEKKLVRYGHLKSDPNKKIVYAALLNTGMVDASIFATDIITNFKPRYLIMPGVCGGKDDDRLKLSDIVIATKVYTFQKGKLKEDGFHPEWEGVELNDKIIQKIEVAEDEILRRIDFTGQVHYEPMACSSAVIDKKGFLDKVIENKDRKTIALEMESYGIARACEIANNGNTKAIIVKSVMDKTTNKNDSAKKSAAKSSANFVMKLIEENVI